MGDDKKSKKRLITLSEHLGISPEILESKGILNAIIGVDTKLFIDPKLVDATEIPEFEDVVSDIHTYVDDLIRINGLAADSPRLQKMAIDMIAIKEPKGLSIGYGNSRDSGTSISQSVARHSLHSLSEMVAVGMKDMRVMEMLGLFIKRFGADSISDLISHIIYARLCKYTQRLARELGVATTTFKIGGIEYRLPMSPIASKQIIFVPLEMLSNLPLATSWEEVAAAAQENERCRKDFNDLVGEDIKKYAAEVKKNPSKVTSSLEAMQTLVKVYSEAVVEPYDRNRDPTGYLRVTQFAAELNETLPIPTTTIKTASEMVTFINEEIIAQFRRNLEQLGVNSLLYHRNGEAVDYSRPVREDAAQILFHTVADHICRKNDILVNREPQVGNGAVDFTIGQGYSNKAVVEIKKSNNKNLLDGYKLQLEEYVVRENAASAMYVVVIVSDSSIQNPDSQLNELQSLYAKNIRDGVKCPQLIVINGRSQIQPSKLRAVDAPQSE